MLVGCKCDRGKHCEGIMTLGHRTCGPQITNKDNWVPACGGSEVPFRIRGYHLWYMWNTETGEHAYLDLDRDVFLTNDEVVDIWSR